jgi:hypothetical protein
METYEKPNVTDYGTLEELTANGSLANADVHGVPNSAFSA